MYAHNPPTKAPKTETPIAKETVPLNTFIIKYEPSNITNILTICSIS